MQTMVTLVHKNCVRNCRICNYGDAAPVAYERIHQTIDTLTSQGYRVHLFDFEVKPESLEVYRHTQQFARSNPGWLNITANFRAEATDLSYFASLQCNLAISLHGSTAELHRLSSGHNDFAAIVAFIQRFQHLHQRRIGINCVVNKHNLRDMHSFLQFCERELNPSFVEFIPLGNTGHALTQLGPAYVLDDDDRFEAFCTVLEAKRRYAFSVELDAVWGPDFVLEPHKQCTFFHRPVGKAYCNAGINHLGLRLEDNKVFPCPCMAGLDDFAMGYFDGQQIVIDNPWRARYRDLEEPCASCDKFRWCYGACRLFVVVDNKTKTGRFNPQVGFDACLYRLAHKNRERVRALLPEPIAARW